MSNSNAVGVTIAYSQKANDRKSFEAEINLMEAINTLLDQHKELCDHKDHVKPTVTVNTPTEYGCRLTLKFPVRNVSNNTYQYARLHFVLQSLGKILKDHEANFARMESYLDHYNMQEPWALVAGPGQVLLRKGATQWNATGDDIPSFDLMYSAPLNGMTVMGEPAAVEKFRRVWQYYSRANAGRIAKERDGMVRAGVPTGAKLNIQSLKYNHPNIPWQNLLVWVHVQTEAGGQWIVTNLDATNQWVLMGVKYVNINMKSMMEDQLPFTKNYFSTCGAGADMRFFKNMEYASFETHEETVYDGTASIVQQHDVIAEAVAVEHREAEAV